LLKYILAAAGQEDPGQCEVGPIHLIKYVYLADLIFAEKHGGKPSPARPGDSIILVPGHRKSMAELSRL
jgi:hypothetical protein